MSETTTGRTGLAEFLLARIAEDEEWAQEALDLSDGLGVTREWRWVRFYSRAGSTAPSSSSFYKGAPSPARVLAECEAKRRMLALADEWDEEARNYRIAEPVHFRALADSAEGHARALRAAARAVTADAPVVQPPGRTAMSETTTGETP